VQYTNGNPAKIARNFAIAEDRIAGLSSNQIAPKHNLSPRQVQYILNSPEIQHKINKATLHLIDMAPKAIENYEMLLGNPFHSDHYKASKDVLQAIGILASHAPATVINNIMYQDNRQLLSPEAADLVRYQTDQQAIEADSFEVIDDET